jgi:hypothetical protein
MDACVYYRTKKKEGKVRLGGTRARVHRRGYAGTGTRVNGYGYNGFFSKKTLPDPSQTRIRVPVYPPIPGHGYGPRVHGYGLYPAGFSKPLVPYNILKPELTDCRGGCRILISGSIIEFSSLSGSNSLINRVLNKNKRQNNK